MAANADGNSTRLDRLGVHSTFSQLVEVTLKRTHFVIPEGVDHLEVFVASFPPIDPRGTAGLKLFPTPTDPNTKVETAIR